MTKASYVDGFVFSVPKSKMAAYKKMCTEAKQVWTKFGALDYKECVIDDAAPKGIVMTFGKMVKPKAGEQVWFSFITYKDKAHRKAVNKKVMAHFDKKYAEKKDFNMPFDMRRMAMAGFKVVVG